MIVELMRENTKLKNNNKKAVRIIEKEILGQIDDIGITDDLKYVVELLKKLDN